MHVINQNEWIGFKSTSLLSMRVQSFEKKVGWIEVKLKSLDRF